MRDVIVVVCAIILLGACARLDHIHISDIDQREGTLTAISVTVNEQAVESSEIVTLSVAIAGALLDSPEMVKHANELGDLIYLMQLGPRTGNPTSNGHYAENVLEQLYTQCPSGNITGLRSVRESVTFGPVSGEIVRINAFCVH